MKKKYLKPKVEIITLDAEDIITDIIYGNMSMGEIDEDLV